MRPKWETFTRFHSLRCVDLNESSSTQFQCSVERSNKKKIWRKIMARKSVFIVTEMSKYEAALQWGVKNPSRGLRNPKIKHISVPLHFSSLINNTKKIMSRAFFLQYHEKLINIRSLVKGFLVSLRILSVECGKFKLVEKFLLSQKIAFFVSRMEEEEVEEEKLYNLDDRTDNEVIKMKFKTASFHVTSSWWFRFSWFSCVVKWRRTVTKFLSDDKSRLYLYENSLRCLSILDKSIFPSSKHSHWFVYNMSIMRLNWIERQHFC